MKTGTSFRLIGCLSRDVLLINRQRNSNLLISGGILFPFQVQTYLMDEHTQRQRLLHAAVLVVLSFGRECSPCI